MVPVAPRSGGRLVGHRRGGRRAGPPRAGAGAHRVDRPGPDRAGDAGTRATGAHPVRAHAQPGGAEFRLVRRTRPHAHRAAGGAGRRAGGPRRSATTTSSWRLPTAPVLRRDGELGQFVAGRPGGVHAGLLRAAARDAPTSTKKTSPASSWASRSSCTPTRCPSALFDGEVAEITPKGDPVSRSYRVRIRFADAPAGNAGRCAAGMTMDANLIVSRREGALLVPNRALKGDERVGARATAACTAAR